jgi:2-(1,2-epoxy-1,2-dihydrophenyl)acetyl-CoA isomerase
MPESTIVQSETQDGVLTITLNRPPVNAFTAEMIALTRSAVKKAAADPQVRCVLLTGSGRYFSTGHDLNEVLAAKDESFYYHLGQTFNPLVLEVRALPKPVIAAINGTVAGAALGVALACDLRMAAEEAQFMVGFLGVGLSLDAGTSYFLPRLIGLGRAAEYAFTNQPINAQQALAWGMVNRLAPADQIQQQAMEWAQEIARGPVGAMGLAKRSFNKSLYSGLEVALDYEAHLQEIARRGGEFSEGLAAFLEKRPAEFL